MIIVMQRHAGAAEIDRVIAEIRANGLREHLSQGDERTLIGALGDERLFDPARIERLAGVEKAIRILDDWRIISREVQADDSVITVRGIRLNPKSSVFSVHALPLAAKECRHDSGAVLFDPFRLPENPYFSAHLNEKEAAQTLREACAYWHAEQKAVFVRIRDSRQIQAALAAEADVLYVGGEWMANRAVLNELGQLNTPVVLCKDRHHTAEEWLRAAESVALEGNHHIILGDAGTLNLHNRRLSLDIDAVAQVRHLSHLPVLADISALEHAYMPRETLIKLAQAAGAAMIIAA